MRLLWNGFIISLLPFVLWQQGTSEKYPEFAVPLLFIWLAVISPMLDDWPEWRWKWNRLKRLRKFALKVDDNDLLGEIDEELEWVRDWNTPTTLGSIKSLMGKYQNSDYQRMDKIEKRVAELKQTQHSREKNIDQK